MKSLSRKPGYERLLGDLSGLLEQARRTTARAVNALMTATFWEIGRRIVEFEQHGADRAAYGTGLLDRLAADLTERFGRGFARPNLIRARQFYLALPPEVIRSTLSNKSAPLQPHEIRSTPSKELDGAVSTSSEIVPTSSAESPVEIRSTPSGISGTTSRKSSPFTLTDLAEAFPLPWSHYVLLLGRARSPEAFAFYHAEALRGGWSVRQLDRQMASLFYERAARSKNKAGMLKQGARPAPADALSAGEEVRDPLILEFLDLKDEYSESDLEAALVAHLEAFLLELGGDFAFVGRQRRLRIGDEWYRVDLLFFHRRLRCLIVIDLKLGKFTHADAGQMHLYLNYAREHWMQPGENPPVGLILCTAKDNALARYALEGLPSKVLAREYRLALPEEKRLAKELETTRRQLEARR
jgi:predicted nuclease of restriction endonuclease-like (RecB) superfamily